MVHTRIVPATYVTYTDTMLDTLLALLHHSLTIAMMAVGTFLCASIAWYLYTHKDDIAKKPRPKIDVVIYWVGWLALLSFVAYRLEIQNPPLEHYAEFGNRTAIGIVILACVVMYLAHVVWDTWVAPSSLACKVRTLHRAHPSLWKYFLTFVIIADLTFLALGFYELLAH